MKIKILILALLFPFFVDGQISAAKRLLLNQTIDPAYDGNSKYFNLAGCPYGNGALIFQSITVSVVTDNYSGSVADSIQVIAITSDYDGDGYGGWVLTNTFGGASVSLPVTRNLSSGSASPVLGLSYTVNTSSDVCEKIGIANADESMIIYRIKGENEIWGSYKKFICGVYN